MGTDIHFYVEVRQDSAWISADTWEPSSWDPKVLSVPYNKSFYSDRNYDLFAILADVRNGRGFAGIKTGEGFNPISPPRGFPDNLSPQLATEADEYCEHTPSWLTLAELLAYDWTQTTSKQGYLAWTEFAEWARWNRGKGNPPTSYCGGVEGPKVVKISQAQAQELLQAKAAPPDLDNTYVLCQWKLTYYQAAAHFLSHTMPRLWRLGKPEDVRVVFWFDS